MEGRLFGWGMTEGIAVKGGGGGSAKEVERNGVCMKRLKVLLSLCKLIF